MKKITAIVFVAMIVVGGVLMWQHYKAPMPVVEGGDMQTYQSNEAALGFQYPKNYTVTARSDAYQGAPIHVITLVEASSTVPDMSEGPTAISVIELPIVATTSLANWVRDNSISNFYMSHDKVFASTTVGGEEALAYRYSGLYESDAVAVAHGGKIYLFAASWIDAHDRIRTDFERILSSVTFIP